MAEIHVKIEVKAPKLPPEIMAAIQKGQPYKVRIEQQQATKKQRLTYKAIIELCDI